MFKKEKVVMLPINEKADTFIMLRHGKLIYQTQYHTQEYLKIIGATSNHLYVISNDEELEINDWFIVNDIVHKCIEINKVSGDIESNNGLCYNKTKCKKIIATTDSSLTKVVINGDYPVDGIPLPQPSQSFIEKYIECYNKGEIIDDVMVEYEELQTMDAEAKYFNQLKINPKDNTITIKKIKNSWNREELDDMLSQQAAATASQILQKFKGYKSREEVIINLLNYRNDLLVEISRCRELGKPLQKKFTDEWIKKNL